MNLYSILILSAALFVIGLYGALNRKRAIQIFISIEIMLSAANLNFIAFSYFNNDNLLNYHGHSFVLFIITVAALEAAIGLAIILAFNRINNSTSIDKAKELKN